MARYFTICVFWELNEFDNLFDSCLKNISSNNFNINYQYPTFHLYKFKPFDDHEEIVLNAVNSGCQVKDFYYYIGDKLLYTYLICDHSI